MKLNKDKSDCPFDMDRHDNVMQQTLLAFYDGKLAPVAVDLRPGGRVSQEKLGIELEDDFFDQPMVMVGLIGVKDFGIGRTIFSVEEVQYPQAVAVLAKTSGAVIPYGSAMIPIADAQPIADVPAKALAVYLKPVWVRCLCGERGCPGANVGQCCRVGLQPDTGEWKATVHTQNRISGRPHVFDHASLNEIEPAVPPDQWGAKS